MNNSSYYQGKIDQYLLVKNSIEALYPYFDNCLSIANNKLIKDFNNIVVNGVSILDSSDGSLSMSQISLDLSDCKSKLGEIVSECSKKIEEYTVLMEQALAREREANEEDE